MAVWSFIATATATHRESASTSPTHSLIFSPARATRSSNRATPPVVGRFRKRLPIPRLRRYFIHKYGARERVIHHGTFHGRFSHHDDGGIVSERYDGGLPWPLGAATWFMERQPFDLRVVFDYYFPDGLPDPAGVPASFTMSREINERVASCPRRSRTKPKFSGAGPASARIRN